MKISAMIQELYTFQFRLKIPMMSTVEEENTSDSNICDMDQEVNDTQSKELETL
jgi:hypothetical protein